MFCDVDSAIIFFVYQYLNSERDACPPLNIVLDILDNGDVVEIDVSGFKYTLLTLGDLDNNVESCHLPAFYVPDECYTIAGLCGVLRRVSNAR